MLLAHAFGPNDQGASVLVLAGLFLVSIGLGVSLIDSSLVRSRIGDFYRRKLTHIWASICLFLCVPLPIPDPAVARSYSEHLYLLAAKYLRFGPGEDRSVVESLLSNDDRASYDFIFKLCAVVISMTMIGKYNLPSKDEVTGEMEFKVDKGVITFGIVISIMFCFDIPYTLAIPVLFADPLAAIIGNCTFNRMESQFSSAHEHYVGRYLAAKTAKISLTEDMRTEYLTEYERATPNYAVQLLGLKPYDRGTIIGSILITLVTAIWACTFYELELYQVISVAINFAVIEEVTGSMDNLFLFLPVLVDTLVHDIYTSALYVTTFIVIFKQVFVNVKTRISSAKTDQELDHPVEDERPNDPSMLNEINEIVADAFDDLPASNAVKMHRKAEAAEALEATEKIN